MVVGLWFNHKDVIVSHIGICHRITEQRLKIEDEEENQRGRKGENR